jgi:hypothetical protein
MVWVQVFILATGRLCDRPANESVLVRCAECEKSGRQKRPVGCPPAFGRTMVCMESATSVKRTRTANEILEAYLNAECVLAAMSAYP